MSTRPTDMAPTNWNVIPSISLLLLLFHLILKFLFFFLFFFFSLFFLYQFQMECFHRLLMLIEVDEGEVRATNKYPLRRRWKAEEPEELEEPEQRTRWIHTKGQSGTFFSFFFFSPVNIGSFVTVWLVCWTRQEVRVSPVCRLTVAISLRFAPT